MYLEIVFIVALGGAFFTAYTSLEEESRIQEERDIPISRSSAASVLLHPRVI